MTMPTPKNTAALLAEFASTGMGNLQATDIQNIIASVLNTVDNPCQAFGLSLLNQANAGAARTALGAAPVASPSFTGTVTVPSIHSDGGQIVSDGAGNMTVNNGIFGTADIGSLTVDNGINSDGGAFTTDGSGNVTATNNGTVINGNDFLTENSYRFDQTLQSGDVGNACTYLNGTDGGIHFKDLSGNDHALQFADKLPNPWVYTSSALSGSL
jgi:hypothetical protein